MVRERVIEFWVGILVLLGLASLIVLAFKVSGLSGHLGQKTYEVSASFDNIGGLKPRSQVTLAGVKIGEVSTVELNPQTFKAKVTLSLYDWANTIPTDSSASIYTEGLLGANYISLTPGFDNTFLKQGNVLQETHSALILENLIGQFLYSMKNKDNNEKDNKESAEEKNE